MAENINLTLQDIAKGINIADYEDALAEPNRGALGRGIEAEGETRNGPALDQFYRPGSLVSQDLVAKYTKKVLQESFQMMGQGSPDNVLQNFLSRLDRHGTTLVPLNSLNYGYTFITRPRLNLTQANIRMNPILNMLYTEDENSVPFMIRMLLDTRLCNGVPFLGMNTNSPVGRETKLFSDKAVKSGLVDVYNPFLVPLCNGLKGISGFPDFTLQEETTEGDYHSGDFTFIKGSDMNNRTQELSLEFRDVSGSIILSIVYMWCLVMALQAKGVIVAYPDDIYEQRLNYTVSIYRFIVDPSRRNILWWAKATGCFPKSVPIGALFNINQGEVTLSSAMNFSIPFVANDVKYQDPAILTDFNRLIDRYTGDSIKKDKSQQMWKNVDVVARENFIGLPYIESTDTGLILQWKTHNVYNDALYGSPADPETESWESLQQQIVQDRENKISNLTGQNFDDDRGIDV